MLAWMVMKSLFIECAFRRGPTNGACFWGGKPLAVTIVRVTCGLCDQMHLPCFTVVRLRLFLLHDENLNTQF